MPPRTKTLLESLADLSSTAPEDFDPERAGSEGVGLGQDSDAEEDNEGGREHYVSVGRGKLRNQIGFDLEDPKYAGKRVSRKALFADDAQEDDEGEEEDEEGSEMEELGDDGSLAGLDDEKEMDMDGFDEFEGSESNAEDSEGDDEEGKGFGSEEGDEEDEEGFGSDDDDGTTATQARLAKELAQLEVEEKKLVRSMSASAKADTDKGKHVRAQIALWDGLLDGRVRIQQAVTIANRFPKQEVYSAVRTDETQSGIAEASKELAELVDGLLDLRTALVAQNEAINIPNIDSLSKKRKRDHSNPDQLLSSMWSEAHALDEGFTGFRDQTIEKWNNKVQVASGIPMQKKFKAINQSVMSQIKQVLGDKDRLLKRTRLRRSEFRCLGEVPKYDKNDLEEQNNEDADNERADAHLSNYDNEIFDDGDYYQQLLRELIESRMTDTDDPILLGMKWAQLKQLQQKQRKKRKVDTRASKGRKIRYHVHEKIQNFMAPQPKGTWHEEMLEELFAGLLGQRHEEAGNKEVEVIVQNEGGLVSMDGLKILGR
ncbi:hypothetical protein HK097_011005 [Rhizophlyctis rosea]|uniref:Protein BFR2 n=1 Tax=Rhizophlyctis rosea TaxID=64517 RepID=A0AAD5X7W0_9FUNG|nr:hypothetical protein HK097_011005 [Rhizophlyctis rosea]